MTSKAPTEISSRGWANAFIERFSVRTRRHSKRYFPRPLAFLVSKIYSTATRPQTDPSGYEAELARHMLISEQRRAAILAPLLTGLLLLVAAYGLAARFRGLAIPAYGWILLIGCLACAYEWFVRWFLAHAVQRGFQPARFRFYLNAMVELSVPMIMTLVVAAHTNPVSAMSGPASYTYFLFIILSALRLDFRLCLFTGAIAALAYGFTAATHWSALEAASLEPALTMRFSFSVRALIYLLSGLVAGLVCVRIRKLLVETMQTTRERERVIALFGQHVSPNVVDQLLTQPRGDTSELRNVCILVLDIRNFTTFAEKRSPAEVVALLNTLWSFMVRAINEYHGFINKFLGDGFLAVFGAPISAANDCQNALAAAQRILRELDDLTLASALPSVQIGMAVHAGEAIVGNIGSAERKEYTVIGDVVNVAFRMEALNKDFGSRLLISDCVRQTAEVNGAKLVAPVQVRGRDETVEVYHVA